VLSLKHLIDEVAAAGSEMGRTGISHRLYISRSDFHEEKVSSNGMKKTIWILIAIVFAVNSIFAQASSPGEVTPGDSLVVEGIPKIPIALAPKVNRYTNAYGFRLAGWDQAERKILLKNLAPGETWILRGGTDPASPKLLTWMPTGVYDIYYQPQRKYFVYNKDADGNDSFQFYLYDIASHKSALITDGKSRNTEPVWSNAGDKIVYSSSPPAGNGVDLSILNPLDPKGLRQLAEGKGNYLKAYDWSPDDRKVLVCDFASNAQSTLWMIDVGSGERTLLSPKTAKADEYYDNPQFSNDGKGVYVITDHDSDFRRLAFLDLESKKLEYLSDDIHWDVEEFSLSPDGKTVAFVTNEDGSSRLRLLDTKSARGSMGPDLPIGIISDLRWRNNSIDLAFNFRSPRTPNDVYCVDTSTGKAEQCYKGVLGGIDPQKLPEPQRVSWRSFDGRMIPGFLYRPPVEFAGKRPVVINIHGGPVEQYRPDFGHQDNYFLNELGIALIFPNIRGSRGYGKTFHKLDDGMLRVNAVKDIGALLNWIKSQPYLDADQIMVQGGSYGGYVALCVATNYSERIRGVISDSGPSNLITFMENTAGWRRDLQRLEYGDERDPKMREFLERTAPTTNASKIIKPLFIIQGENDPRVPATESRQMVAAVKKNGIPVWFLLARDEGHDWKKQANRNFKMYAIALFVQENLLKQSP
jgi:dipeptidyl aminopeptidase/acylaminoacyl peptidase